jgi:hypothetical protein
MEPPLLTTFQSGLGWVVQHTLSTHWGPGPSLTLLKLISRDRQPQPGVSECSGRLG